MLKYIMPASRPNKCDMAYKAGFHLLGLSLCLLAYQKLVMPMCGYETQAKGFAVAQRQHGVEEGVGKAKTRAEKAEKRVKELEAELGQKVNKLDIELRPDQDAIAAAKDFEKDYQNEAERLINACASAGEKVPTKDGKRDLDIFEQTWSPAAAVGDEDKIRVVQFNTLAHGLSGEGSGFGTYYNLEKINKLMGHLLLSGEMTPTMTGKNDWSKFGLVDDKYAPRVLRPEPIRELMYSRTWGPIADKKIGYPVPARVKRLIALVLRQKADIITLQEVDHFKYMEETLNHFGYEGKFEAKITSPGLFSKKSNGNGRTADKDEGDWVNGCDGVAVFWKTEKFDLADPEAETRFKLPLVIAAKYKIEYEKDQNGKNKTNAAGENIAPKVHPLDKFCKSINKVSQDLAKQFKVSVAEKADEKSLKFDLEQLNAPAGVEPIKLRLTAQTKDIPGEGKKTTQVVRFNFGTILSTESDLINQYQNAAKTFDVQAKQVAMKVVLKRKGTQEKVTIFSGHFKSGEKPDDIACKPIHTAYFNKELKRLSAANENVIVGMDFNTAMNTKAFKDFETAILNKGILKSAYKYPDQEGEGRFTASKWRRGGTQPDKCKLVEQIIDYIFHTGNFETVRTLSVPTSETVAKKSPLRLPCWQYPSDHFMIGADLVFKN